jgi:hypothetical protein
MLRRASARGTFERRAGGAGGLEVGERRCLVSHRHRNCGIIGGLASAIDPPASLQLQGVIRELIARAKHDRNWNAASPLKSAAERGIVVA